MITLDDVERAGAPCQWRLAGEASRPVIARRMRQAIGVAMAR
jgi:hypothetical protein